jgi:CheY-like chemotaxis protein
MQDPILLLVEDDPLVMLVAQEALESGGYTVVSVAGGAEALAALDAGKTEFAGIVTDIRMGPGPDGWDVARHARELKPDVPVVYVSGDSAAEWPVHGVPKSVIVQKPYAPSQLLTAVSTLMTKADTNRAS